jgi:pimeloyl-ACP methyl ester carboxylesterase
MKVISKLLLTILISATVAHGNGSLRYVAAHGFGDRGNNNVSMLQQLKIIQSNCGITSFDFPEVQNPACANLGQDADIAALAQANNQQKDQDTALVGFSRGAATALSYVGRDKPTNIKAIVAIAPFDTPKNIVQGFLKSPTLSWIAHRLGFISLFGGCPQYSSSGITPSDVVDEIPENIPVIFITSDQDTLIRASQVCNLYNTMRAQGRENVHIYVLENGGSHNQMMADKRVSQVVNAFYKRYNLPHNATLAEQGELLFDESQPTSNQLKKHKPWAWTIDCALAAVIAAVSYAKWG